MNSERKAFEEVFPIPAHWIEYDENLNKYYCPYASDYGASMYQARWEAWQASAQRKGYKLVPLEISWQKADDIASKEWDKNRSMFCSDNRDMTALQVEEFRLRWCRNKAHQIMGEYKAMIGAVDE